MALSKEQIESIASAVTAKAETMIANRVQAREWSPADIGKVKAAVAGKLS